MYLLAGKQWRSKTLLKCFLVMKTKLPMNEIKEYLLNNNKKLLSFSLVRINCDLTQLSKRFLAKKRKSLVFNLKKLNKKFIKLIKEEARKASSFLRFNSDFKYEVSKRLTVEQRILSESFDSRGIHVHIINTIYSFFIYLFFTSFLSIFFPFILLLILY